MPEPELHPLLNHEDIENTPLYPIIHMIRSDVLYFIDTPLSYETLASPDITYTLVQPLVEKYLALQRNGNMSITFCFLVNRVHFLRDDDLLTMTISRSRAELCEILATRVFRDYGNNLLRLTLALTTTWPVYNGADPTVVSRARIERDGDLDDKVGNAIEMAILGQAKRFIKSSACQKVINAIWSGKCVYQAQSSHSILSDTYKRTPIHFYDPHKAPLLDHYRLKVPAIRSVLEYLNFLVLFILFVYAIEVDQERGRLDKPEALFMIYALGFTLEKIAAMQEHGIKVYFKGTWNGFDLAFVTIFTVYASLRIYGVVHGDAWARELGIDCLALIACLLFPRLAFVTLKNNLMVLSLRAMLVQFVVLMVIAAFCFCGFLYALWILSRTQAGYGVGTIAWWMLDLFFGLDASGFDHSTEFHPTFGPALMVTYACLSNTLLLTVLVSILSNTFAKINEDAAAEAIFRKAVSTIEGVKADFLFSYQPPVNLAALCILLPTSFILTPRWFHKVNVFLIRLTNFPILLLISLYERQSKKTGATNLRELAATTVEDTILRPLRRFSIFEGLAGSGADIDAIFYIEEEFESALETEEGSDRQPFSRYPTMSQNPPPRHPTLSTQPPPSPPPKLQIQPRRSFETSQNFASPLAQVFQPVIVTQSIPEEPSDKTPTPPGALVSYGPATRRRLYSMQSGRNQRPEAPTSQTIGSPLRKFPTFPNQPGGQFGNKQISRSPQEMQRSTSGNDQTISSRSPGCSPERASLTVETSEDWPENRAGEFHWAGRLDDIERRQERIEALLSQIAKTLNEQSNKT